MSLGLIWILINLDRLDLVLIGQDRLAWIHLIQLDPPLIHLIQPLIHLIQLLIHLIWSGKTGCRSNP
jgi:hypothetical protein